MQPDRLYLALFSTSSGAIKFHRFLQNQGIVTESMPVPRKLSSSCATGIKFSYKGNLSMLIIEDIKKVYIIQGNQYILKYEKRH